MNSKTFPLSLAEGSSFCNRDAERTRLKHNFSDIVHTLIISPRRYGKTSLIIQTLHETGMIFGKTQFFNAFKDEIVIKRFTECFNELLSRITPPTKKALSVTSNFLSHAKLSLKIGANLDFSFSIEPTQKNPCDIISSLLKDIEKLLTAKKKNAVIFLDEFQDILNSDMSEELQSILRDFIQHTKVLTFIISGSNRHMLEKLFDDRNKPFYKLFDRILLRRITANDHEKFIQKLALKQWKKKLGTDVIEQIFELSQCHSYYLNNICKRLWRLKITPAFSNVNAAWQEIVDEEFSSVASELTNLTKNQRVVLQELAHYSALKELASAQFISQVGLSHSSISLAVKALVRNDLVEMHNGGYRVIDPLLKYVLISD